MENKIKYDKKIVVFIDILGFKNIIDETNQDDEKLNQLNLMFDDIIQNIDELMKSKPTELHSITQHGLEDGTVLMYCGDFQITIVSDSIFISCHIGFFEELLELVYKLQFKMSVKGIFLRGGISFGKVIHKGNKIFGPSVNDVVKLEKEHAIYPRIVLESLMKKKIFRLNRITVNEFKFKESNVENFLKQDNYKNEDNYFYIDYIQPYEKYKNDLFNAVETNLKKIKDEKVVQKMEWIKSKILDLKSI